MGRLTAVTAGRPYQLTSPEGIGVGYGRLESGSVVDVLSVTPAGVTFTYPTARTSPPPRLIRYPELFFEEHFTPYTPPVITPPDPEPKPEPDLPEELPTPDEIAQEVQ
ncbi:hypothetical protein AB0B15_03225 [Streptomyces sp. NPDC045456]|uniref:hypothetical protein n=1 Tax=Streptomyces sp. NPDC045456 TaxID=3155254 RepID=UPI0033D7EAB5